MAQRFLTTGFALIAFGFLPPFLAIAIGAGAPYYDVDNMVLGLAADVTMAVLLNTSWILGATGTIAVIIAAFVRPHDAAAESTD